MHVGGMQVLREFSRKHFIAICKRDSELSNLTFLPFGPVRAKLMATTNLIDRVHHLGSMDISYFPNSIAIHKIDFEISNFAFWSKGGVGRNAMVTPTLRGVIPWEARVH